MPSRLGTKIMPIGAILDISPASCTAPLGISAVDRPGRLRGLADDALYRRVARRSRDVIDHFATRLDSFFLVRLRKLLLNVLPHPFDLAGVEIAQFDRKLDSAGNDVRSTRFGLQVADRTDLRTSLSPHDVADGQQVLRGCSERVLAAIHGRRARMVGEASRDALPPLEAHNSAYDPNLNLGLLKNRSLLDMQFEDCSQRTRRYACVGQTRGILSITSQPVGHRESIVILAVEDLRSQYSGRHTGAQRADPKVRTFLVRPDDDFERVAGGESDCH